MLQNIWIAKFYLCACWTSYSHHYYMVTACFVAQASCSYYTDPCWMIMICTAHDYNLSIDTLPSQLDTAACINTVKS